MSVYIVADGGGTKTLFRLIDDERKVLASISAPGTNPAHIGLEQALKTIEENVYALLDKAHLSQADVSMAALFIPLLWRKSSLLDSMFSFPTEVLSDVVAAQWAALASGDGILVLSGTGSFACGSYEGKKQLVGGWGPYIDDRGSGFAVGKAALKHAAEQYDSGQMEDSLSQLIKKRFDIPNINELKSRQAQGGFLSPPVIASLCPLVEEAAEQGCTAALEILAQEAEALADMAQLCRRRLEIPECSSIKIAISGGAAINNRLFLSLCTKAIKSRLPGAEPFPSFRTPIDGAMEYVLSKGRNGSDVG